MTVVENYDIKFHACAKNPIKNLAILLARNTIDFYVPTILTRLRH